MGAVNRRVRLGSRTYLLGIPPVRHFPDNRPTEKFDATITGIVTLVEDKVEITAGTIDIVHQKVSGKHIPIRAPL